MATEQLSQPRSGASSAGQVVRAALHNRGFVACAALLILLTTGFHLIMWGYKFVKDSLPLRVPLNQMSQERLAPYKLRQPIELQPDLLDQLGTRQYVQWILQEPDSPDGKEPGRIISFFVTYYTGSPDAVPHIPQSCYVGSGYVPKEETPDQITIISSRGQEIVVPLQTLEFEKDNRLTQSKKMVVYTFHANGQFRKDRNDVRWAIGSLTDRYAYFTKVEVSMDLEPGRFSKEQAVGSAKRFLQVAIPVLLEDHWPDWEAANGQPTTRPAQASK